MGRKKSWKKPKYPRSSRQDSQPEPIDVHLNPTIFAEVESLFKKQFTFNAGEGDHWTLPSVDTWFTQEPWTDQVLIENKEALNTVKSSLSDKDINQWHEHTQLTNRAGNVMQQVRRSRKPELCTQAWCKFHEIIASFPILPHHVRRIVSPDDNPDSSIQDGVPGVKLETGLHSVHLCEAPGAFIASLNHYLQTRGYHGDWTWTGNTLNPYYEGNDLSEMVTDDRLILDTLPNWYFGPDDSGDILHVETIQGIKEHALTHGHAQLVTCDGSIDCQNKPDLQEALVAPLHHAEVTAAILLLAEGGSLVLKMFTLFEHTSICMMYLLNCCFKSVHVFKPATSKAGNSEVYVICVGYKGCSVEVRDKLISISNRHLPENAMFKQEDIPASYLNEHHKCCEVFVRFQIQTIEENISLFQVMTSEQRTHLAAVRQHCGASYIERFNIRLLPNHAFLVPPFQTVSGHGWSKTHQSRTRKCHTGSYTDRQMLLGLNWSERLTQASLYNVRLDDPQAIQGETQLETEPLRTWPVISGHIPDVIISSQFCDTAILQWYNELVSHQKRNQLSAVDFGELISMLETTCPVPMDEDQTEVATAVVTLDLEAGALGNCLIKSSKFQTQQSDDIGSETHRLFVCESWKPKTSTKQGIHHHELIKALHKMYQTLNTGDHCIILLPHLLSRMYTGVVYALYASFNEVSVKVLSENVNIPVAVIGKCSHIEDRLPILTWLKECIRATEAVADTAHSILQITPIHVLFESQFYHFVCECNEALLKIRSDKMLHLQRQEDVETENGKTSPEKSECMQR